MTIQYDVHRYHESHFEEDARLEDMLDAACSKRHLHSTDSQSYLTRDTGSSFLARPAVEDPQYLSPLDSDDMYANMAKDEFECFYQNTNCKEHYICDLEPEMDTAHYSCNKDNRNQRTFAGAQRGLVDLDRAGGPGSGQGMRQQFGRQTQERQKQQYGGQTQERQKVAFGNTVHRDEGLSVRVAADDRLDLFGERLTGPTTVRPARIGLASFWLSQPPPKRRRFQFRKFDPNSLVEKPTVLQILSEICDSGCNVLFMSHGIADTALGRFASDFLGKKKVCVVGNVSASDMSMLSNQLELPVVASADGFGRAQMRDADMVDCAVADHMVTVSRFRKKKTQTIDQYRSQKQSKSGSRSSSPATSSPAKATVKSTPRVLPPRPSTSRGSAPQKNNKDKLTHDLLNMGFPRWQINTVLAKPSVRTMHQAVGQIEELQKAADRKEKQKAQAAAIERKKQSRPTYDARMPEGWNVKETAQGKRYFVNHNTRETSWDDPRPLPRGWVVKKHGGKNLFIDNGNKKTQWQDPRPAIQPGVRGR